ncbi:calmodulin [Ectothiorhodospiraceae bacterium WFHF3C12]|nr:calmodulin [Ectothiorhodospiraceae bacterium WFHF3C12]
MKAKWIAGALLIALASVAMAGEKGMGTAAMKQLDANGDGMISPEEATAHPRLSENFDEYDTDGSGTLEQGEFARFETMSQEREMKQKGKNE